MVEISYLIVNWDDVVPEEEQDQRATIGDDDLHMDRLQITIPAKVITDVGGVLGDDDYIRFAGKKGECIGKKAGMWRAAGLDVHIQLPPSPVTMRFVIRRDPEDGVYHATEDVGKLIPMARAKGAPPVPRPTKLRRAWYEKYVTPLLKPYATKLLNTLEDCTDEGLKRVPAGIGARSLERQTEGLGPEFTGISAFFKRPGERRLGGKKKTRRTQKSKRTRRGKRI
jgi:hypothetical protein